MSGLERTLTWRQPEAENASDWGGFWLFLTLAAALLKLQFDTLNLIVRFFPFREVTPGSSRKPRKRHPATLQHAAVLVRRELHVELQ